MTRIVCALVTAGVVWGIPAVVLACPVCFSAKDEANRLAFLVSSVFLTALPLVLMGAFIGWAARRAKALDEPAALDDSFDQSDSDSALSEPSRVVSLASVEPGRSESDGPELRV